MSETAAVQEVQPIAKPIKKTAAKGAAKAVAKAPVDLIQDTAYQIENLSKEKALKTLETLVEDDEFSAFKMGGLFAVINDRGWYEGYESFDAFVKQKYNVSYRVARHYINIYTALVNSKVQWEDVKALGWTKLRIIANVLTEENAAVWIAKAAALSCVQLEDVVKQAKLATASGAEASETATVTSQVSTMSFKVHPDQRENIRAALDKAKEEANTEFDTVALDNIATAYLAGAIVVQKKPTLKELMEGASPEEVLGVFEEVFPNVNLTVTS